MSPDKPSPEVPIEENPKRLQHRMEWEIRRARKGSGSIEVAEYTAIKMPDYDGLKHAAMVVAGRLADLPDAVAATREVLEALAIPRMLRGEDPG